MTFAEWVVAIVLALPISKADRAVEPEVKRAQLQTIAAAIADAAEGTQWPGDPRELAVALTVTAAFESGLALNIHAGKCKPLECDRGLARGLWQQQVVSTSSRAAWLELVGIDADSTRLAAREAARALARARWMCRSLERQGLPWVPMTVAAYAGRGCRGWFSGAESRVKAIRRLLAL